MGKHRKIRGEAKHAKPASHPVAKKVATFGAAAATVPTLALTFSGSAHAATLSEWNAVSIPEAGGDWCIDHSSDGLSVGGLQFQNPSWHDALANLNSHGFNTSQWPQNLTQFMGRDNVPSKDQQVLAGESLLQLQGRGAWANGNGSGLESSMFNGGPNPWGLPGTQAPAGIEQHASCTGGSTPVTPPPTPNPAPTPVPGDTQYTVVAGDTLFKIAAAHGVTLDALEADNPQIVNFDVIEIGDVINIPPASTPAPVPTPTPTPGHHHHRRHHHHHRPAPVPPSPVVPPAPPAPPAPTPQVAPAACDHIVVPGDTVSQVAALDGAPLAQVESVNPGIIAGARPDDFSLIFAGGHIHMPAGFCDGNQ